MFHHISRFLQRALGKTETIAFVECPKCHMQNSYTDKLENCLWCGYMMIYRRQKYSEEL